MCDLLTHVICGACRNVHALSQRSDRGRDHVLGLGWCHAAQLFPGGNWGIVVVVPPIDGLKEFMTFNMKLWGHMRRGIEHQTHTA